MCRFAPLIELPKNYFEFFLSFATERCIKIQVLVDEFNRNKFNFAPRNLIIKKIKIENKKV